MPQTFSPNDPHSRRDFLVTASGVAAAAAFSGTALAADVKAPKVASSVPHHGADNGSSTIVTADGTRIFYKDWGSGQPIVLSHGWPLTSDAWDSQMVFLASHGFRVIAHDRRSHGRSGQTWNGNDMDTYADDLSTLIETLDLKQAILIGHSTGGGEVARYIGRHGTKRLAKAVLISAVPPLMLKTASNPNGIPQSVFDDIRNGVANNRSGFYQNLAIPFYGYNRPGVKPDQGVIDAFWLQGMQGGIKGQFECIKQFSETDFTADLKKFDIPALVLQGDDDQIVPIGASGNLSSKIIPKAQFKVLPGASHGMCTVSAAAVNAALLEFIKG
jgi:non-heme chloroperoxidase